MGTHRAELDGNVKLTIGGNGEINRLKQAIKFQQIESMVNFVGWVSGEQKQRLLAESDVYLLPSYSEGLPMSILEAMNAGLPVLSTPVGGIPEIVIDGLNGYLVKPGDEEALYDRLMRFVNQPDLVATMGAASGRIVAQYQPEVIFAQLQALYESLLQRPA
jgi:glycosyltransferase involved in cell wall biosynthesis